MRARSRALRIGTLSIETFGAGFLLVNWSGVSRKEMLSSRSQDLVQKLTKPLKIVENLEVKNS